MPSEFNIRWHRCWWKDVTQTSDFAPTIRLCVWLRKVRALPSCLFLPDIIICLWKLLRQLFLGQINPAFVIKSSYPDHRISEWVKSKQVRTRPAHILAFTEHRQESEILWPQKFTFWLISLMDPWNERCLGEADYAWVASLFDWDFH